VFFSHDKGKTHASGRLLFSARVIPSRGPGWIRVRLKRYIVCEDRQKEEASGDIVLKALGYSNEELLKTFYPVETITIKGNAFARGVSEVLVGNKSVQNIIAPDTKEVIVREAMKITKGAIKKMESSG